MSRSNDNDSQSHYIVIVGTNTKKGVFVCPETMTMTLKVII